MQSRLRELAAIKLDETRAATARLSTFAADLQRILAGLGRHTPDGPCDEDCGCVGQPAACTLAADELPGRIRE